MGNTFHATQMAGWQRGPEADMVMKEIKPIKKRKPSGSTRDERASSGWDDSREGMSKIEQKKHLKRVVH